MGYVLLIEASSKVILKNGRAGSSGSKNTFWEIVKLIDYDLGW